MPRIKAKCSACKETISILYAEQDPDAPDKTEVGEHFEYKCPLCKKWAAFERLD